MDNFTSFFTVYTSCYGLITVVFTYILRKLIPTVFTLKLDNKRNVTNGCQKSHVVTTFWTAYTSFSYSPTTASRQPTWSSLVPGAGVAEKQETTLLNILLSYCCLVWGCFTFSVNGAGNTSGLLFVTWHQFCTQQNKKLRLLFQFEVIKRMRLSCWRKRKPCHANSHCQSNCDTHLQ